MALFTTLKGLKSRAKKLKKEKAIPHGQALEIVARLGGYQSYQHAYKSLSVD